jgi:small-conductance mechanosensitive channel
LIHINTDTAKVLVRDTVRINGLQNLNSRNAMQPPDIRDLISIPKIIWSLIFLVVGYFVIQILERVINLLAERSTKYRLMIKSIIPVIKIFGWIFIIFIIVAGIFQPPMATILAFSASIGVAVGFASQDILKNIFGGITILFDRPFKVGDKIESGHYYGEVVEIGLRSTRIVTPDDSLVTIPNGELMNQSVANANSGEPNCQVVAEIYLPVHVNTSLIREMTVEAVKVSRYVYLNKPITVLFSHEVKEKSAFLKMKIKAYVLDIRDEFKFKSDIVELVVRELVSREILD